jgi:hypothetical protein
VLTKEFHEKYGPSGNPPGVVNPFPGSPINPEDPFQGSAPTDINPAPGRNPGDAPLRKLYIGPEPAPDQPSDVDGFSGGGHVRGPGTSTSDDIPAMLSDEEFVTKASSVEKIGVDRLNQLNQNPEHFADGGLAEAATGTGYTGIDAKNHPIYGDLTGNLNVTFDPDTGGAYINDNLHVPGDPILSDPRVMAAIERSKASMNDRSKKQEKKHHSVFHADNDGGGYGSFGQDQAFAPGNAAPGFALGGLVGHFAKGGGSVGPSSPITRLQEYFSSHFANGGIIEAPFAHLAIGGMPEMPSANLDKMPIQNSGNGASPLHPVTLNLPGGGSIDGFHAQPSAVSELKRAAMSAKIFQPAGSPVGTAAAGADMAERSFMDSWNLLGGVVELAMQITETDPC